MSERQEFWNVDGLLITSVCDPVVVRQAMKRKPEKGEVIVASYPKCGTTWVGMTVLLLKRRGEPFKTSKEWFGSMGFMENIPPAMLDRMLTPRCLKTHVPFDRLTYSPDAKYIYITRHPADCLVSYYHFLKCVPYHDFPDFDQVFDLFLAGQLDYNDFFDHLLSWYEHRHLPNVLFLTYESAKKDPKGVVLQIAEFLDAGFVPELLADGESLLRKILHHSSLESMKSSINRFYDEALTVPQKEEEKDDFGVAYMSIYFKMMEEAKKRGFKKSTSFVRRGDIGEGNRTLSEEQKDKLNARILEKTAHTDVMDLWKD